MLKWKWTIEYIEVYKTEREMKEGYEFLKYQAGLIGLRMLPWNQVKPQWRTQAFFEDEQAAWLPDGCTRRIIPLHLLTV